MREPLRYSHYARSTEKKYCQWILRYICFYEKKRQPKDMGEREIKSFLSHLDYTQMSPHLRGRLKCLAFLYRTGVGSYRCSKDDHPLSG
ncbi:phage integrase N-terminal SAM-like domain-containing protein [Desulforhopalus vacuolatus]|uniref:phage integrase N-terminal SAM-like domain-containing protein n=1 Tax=Desulforhopalus vacuolatus TaxID=40414 RepID=UPI001962F136|nr:phage integrase N-terminal SAM-like domain-containing protein [Desulforhopalus vacuolatus]